MENFRSKSCRHGSTMIESYYGSRPDPGTGPIPTSMHHLRSYSYSTCHTSESVAHKKMKMKMGKELIKIKKGKNASVVESSSSSSTTSKSWSKNINSELQRKKRIARYKVYSVEGKMKGSLRKSFRWIKDTCTHVIYGFSS
ncbi:unnamed protein product [Camellia sinensis]